MRMKTGPKVLLFALVFVALGFWAGRGFPQTWEAFRQSGKPPVVVPSEPSAPPAATDDLSRRLTELESRVEALEGARQPPTAPAHPAPAAPEFPLDAPTDSL